MHILAGQVEIVTGGMFAKFSIVAVVSIGIAVMLALGLLRIVFNISLRNFLAVTYALILLLSLFSSSEFLAIAFDASGTTTGAMTVPFILALALGISSLKAGKASEEDSFGLLGIASTGAILAVLLLNILVAPGKITGSLADKLIQSTSLWGPFLQAMPATIQEVLLALSPLLALFCFANLCFFKLSRKGFQKIIKGLVFTFVGFVLFLIGVNAGFMDVGTILGQSIASLGSPGLVISLGFILGLVVILAEPAVYVLTEQIENVTSGYLKKPLILGTLSLGVAFAVGLSMLRILVPEIQLWYYLLPGYIISIAMTFFVPKLFIGIAFDSGGVASGTMTATFILAFAQGVAEAVEGADVLIDGFGVISMAALTPVIALQTLGLIFKLKAAKGGVETSGQQADS